MKPIALSVALNSALLDINNDTMQTTDARQRAAEAHRNTVVDMALADHQVAFIQALRQRLQPTASTVAFEEAWASAWNLANAPESTAEWIKVQRVTSPDGSQDLCGLTYANQEGLSITGGGTIQKPLTAVVEPGWALVGGSELEVIRAALRAHRNTLTSALATGRVQQDPEHRDILRAEQRTVNKLLQRLEA